MSQDNVAIPDADQWRNGFVFLVCTALTYLIAPVTYVGILHAAILNSLGTGDAMANLAESVFLWMAPLPVIIAWLWPSPKSLRAMLAITLLVKGAAGAMVAVFLATTPSSWWVPALIVHPAIIGITGGVQNMCLWELIGRGMSPARRGRLLGWTFGLGPVFAVLGSCASQLILGGEFLGWLKMTPLPRPLGYIVLFGASCPAMLISAAAIAVARVPELSQTPSDSPPRPSWREAAKGLREFFSHPYILVAATCFLLTYGGAMIMNNMSLYARETIGEAPEAYAGVQLALRFGFKCLAGFALGWLATRIHAKATLLATTLICALGVAWALFVPGKWYLLSFGLLGAGELFYVFYVNYIVGCSHPRRMRENTAYANLLTGTVGFLPLVFGVVSDYFNLRTSFVVALAILALALILVQWRLPKQPSAALDKPI